MKVRRKYRLIKSTLRMKLSPAPPLSEEQQRFLDAADPSQSASLMAAAGSGKTETVVAYMRKIRDCGFSVRMFSHANKTVNELLDRLKKRAPEHASRDTVSTMHKYSIRRLDSSVRQVDDLEDYIVFCSRALDESAIVFEEDVLLVDEAQDLSKNQMALVRALQRRGVTIVLIGDPMQSIYGFQGSSPEHLQDFVASLPACRRFQLSTNYRSVNRSIVDLANEIAADDVRAERAVHMKAQETAQDYGKPCLVRCENVFQEALTILQPWRGQRPLPSVAVLAHCNETLGNFTAFLLKQNIEVVPHMRSEGSGSTALRTRPVQIHCYTIHGLKGGQADHVLLLTGHDRRAEDEDEDRRVLYVAVTRAIRSFHILYAKDQQPSRWLSRAWRFLDVRGGAEPWVQLPEKPRRTSTSLRVTSVVRDGGRRAMNRSFDMQGSPHGCLEERQLGDGRLEEQAVQAYEHDLHCFVGRLFELEALALLGATSLQRHAQRLLEKVCKMSVNATVWAYFTHHGPGHWMEMGRAILLSLQESLKSGEGIDTAMLTCPDELRANLQSAISQTSINAKYKSLPVTKKLFEALVEAGARSERLPAFEDLFRQHCSDWDQQCNNRVRENYDQIVGACKKIADGDRYEATDVARLAALDFAWTSEDPSRQFALLKMCQSRNSRVWLDASGACLSREAREQLKSDAENILRALGQCQGAQAHVPRVEFLCRRYYADAHPTAPGCVNGVADAVFDEGPLEIKAVRRDISEDHAAQVVWYAQAMRRPRAFLWDVYKRVLYIWGEPSRGSKVFFEDCLEYYLKRNCVPGERHRTWPTEVRVDWQ